MPSQLLHVRQPHVVRQWHGILRLCRQQPVCQLRPCHARVQPIPRHRLRGRSRGKRAEVAEHGQRLQLYVRKCARVAGAHQVRQWHTGTGSQLPSASGVCGYHGEA